MTTSREKLLESAAQEIYTYGFQGASLSRILQNAGVPKGSMYHHFKSKKEMALAVIEERIAPGMLALMETLASDEPLKTSLSRVIEKIAEKEKLVTFGCPVNKLIQEMAALDEDFATLLERIYTQMVSKVVAAVKRARERGEIATDDPEAVGRFLFLTIWAHLATPPSQSSKEAFLSLIPQLTNYLNSLKN